ncbi:hypothetical protein [Phytohabitans kaempferiae]|uniref:Uncharacterized protein n=1 Tax=Phytohabitans kaempferiae TaxID=1620943 RepID=A0ABV6LXS0_9ACTN
MDFFDVAGRIADVTAVPGLVTGFVITYRQLRKTRTAADAARDAAHNAQASIGRSNLLVLIPQLQRVEEELDRAVRQGVEEVVVSALQGWRWQAGQVRGLLEAGRLGNQSLLTDIQHSVTAAAVAQHNLHGPSKNLVSTTHKVRQAIAKVTNELGAVATVQGIQAGDSHVNA